MGLTNRAYSLPCRQSPPSNVHRATSLWTFVWTWNHGNGEKLLLSCKKITSKQGKNPFRFPCGLTWDFPNIFPITLLRIVYVWGLWPSKKEHGADIKRVTSIVSRRLAILTTATVCSVLWTYRFGETIWTQKFVPFYVSNLLSRLLWGLSKTVPEERLYCREPSGRFCLAMAREGWLRSCRITHML